MARVLRNPFHPCIRSQTEKRDNNLGGSEAADDSDAAPLK